MNAFLVGISLIVFVLSARAEDYCWKDKQGRWHYSDQLPLARQSDRDTNLDLDPESRSLKEIPVVKFSKTPLNRASKRLKKNGSAKWSASKRTKSSKSSMKKRQQRCEKLQVQITRYEKLSRRHVLNDDLLAKKRQLKWQKLIECY